MLIHKFALRRAHYTAQKGELPYKKQEKVLEKYNFMSQPKKISSWTA